MALVASSCSQLTWPFWRWESSPLCRVPCVSFPLALFKPPDILKHIFSFLTDFALKLSHDSPSVPSWCGLESEGSSSLVFVEDRDSCDLDLPSPLMIILKWEVNGLSESSDLSWEQFSCGATELTSASSSICGGESNWEITIVGSGEAGLSVPFSAQLQWFSTGKAVNSGCGDGIVFSFGTSVCRLEFCKENNTIVLWQLTLRQQLS